MTEIIFNDKSLKGQFLDVISFCDSSYIYMLPMWKFLLKHGYAVLKSEECYNSKVTHSETFVEILRKNELSQYPEISRIKSMILNLFYDIPFFSSENQDCIIEAFKRNAILLSYKDSEYEDRIINRSIEGKNEKILNSTDKRQLLENLNDKKDYSLDNQIKLDQNKLIIEIRSKENGHKAAHFHISNGSGTNASVLFDLSKITGSIRDADEHIMKEWMSQDYNKELLVELWKYYNPDLPIKE